MKNLMKTAAFAAILGMTTTGATAAGFGLQTVVDDNSTITLSLVRADSDGVVVVYDYTGSEFGEVLGTAEIREGANTQVKVSLGNTTATELAAVIYDGPMTEPTMAASWIELDVNDDN